jgi:ABC-type Fe3+/spermidine/putrescine transport system ATPase subunit
VEQPVNRTVGACLPSVQISDLRKSFRRSIALDGVSLTFSPGVTALVGPNGAGKTTLMRTLAGALVPTSGSVRIGGLLLVGLSGVVHHRGSDVVLRVCKA